MKNKYKIREKKINKAIDSDEILDIFDKVAKEQNIEKTGTFQKNIISYTSEELMDFEKDLDGIHN